jgi:hypothetical protein
LLEIKQENEKTIIMRINQEQRLPYSKKNKQWRVNEVDYLCSKADEFSYDWVRIHQNYRLLNNQLDQEEYRRYCDTLGLDKSEGKKFVEPFNKTHNIINVLKGEENNKPWNYSVINMSPSATNEYLRELNREYGRYVHFEMDKEVQIVQKQQQLEAQMKAGEVSPQQAQRAIGEFMEQMKAQEAEILNPQQIKEKYRNYKSAKELAMSKLLKIMAVNQKLKFLKNETFTDALVAGIEAVHIKIDENDYSKMPTVKQVNPLTLFFHKSPDSPFIHDGDYAGYKEELTIGQTLDQYGDLMHPKDRKRLYTFRNKIYGTETPFASKDGVSQSSWTALKNFEYGYNGGMGVPYYGTNNVLADGLYNSRLNGRYYDDYCVVYTVFWKSQRKVGKYTYTDEYGEIQETIVSEEFVVPKDAVKGTYRRSLMNRPRVRYEWYDEADRYNALEWIWIPEVWTGTRINGDIYVNIEPLEYSYKSLLNPYKVKLPIYGMVYNSRNAQTVSVMDRVKPWQKLYFVVMSKWLKLIAQDKGVVNLINTLFMDKDLGYEKSLQIAIDHGYLPFNPLSHSQGSGIGNTYKAAERLDLSNSQQLSHYTNILQFIENNILTSAGVPPQRLAQTGSNTNVTDNQRDVQQSLNITDTVFSSHDLLWEDILQGLVETAVMSLDSESGYLREILGDHERAVLDLDLIRLEDEYSVRIANNLKAHKDLELGKSMMQSLVQADKVNLSTLLDLMTTDNLAEFKEELKAVEKDIERREQAAQEAAQKRELESREKIARMQLENREDIQNHEILLKELDIEGKKMVAEINAFRFQQDQDSNKDGIPDQLQIGEFKESIREREEKNQIEREKIDQIRDTADKQMAQKERDNQTKIQIANINAQNKRAIESEKAKQKAKESKSKK